MNKKLLGRAQIADMFSVSRRYFRESIEPLPGFPAPDIAFTQKTVLWDETKIILWLQTRRREFKKAA